MKGSDNLINFVYNTLNMKTITISDEVYEKLVRIKEKRIEKLIEAAEKTGYEEELEEISGKIRESFR